MTGEVSPVNPPADGPSRPGLRASHADRDRVVELLRVAAGDGRLTPEELDERLEAALTARTYTELTVLTTDLPEVGQAAAVAAPEAKKLIRIECGSGSATRDGQWIVPERMEISVASGAVKLDLTKALLSSHKLNIDAQIKSGSLLIVTRPGIMVDTDDVAVRSGNVAVRTHRGPEAPVILRVQVSGQVMSGSLRARPPRRTFLQWLLRRPLSYA